MNYFQVHFTLNPVQPFSEILIAELATIGFESFEEKEDGLLAYIPEDDFSEEKLHEIEILRNEQLQARYTSELIQDQNWNAVWESNYEPVTIDKRCYIRAPFHPSKPEIEFEILIEPQMSFGTAHHETTANMISLLLNEDVQGKSVLDMGCGTAVLAILAHKKGANPVCAIDNDEWAYRNAKDNLIKNNIENISVHLGDAKLLKEKSFDIIFANINKNILLADIETYAKSLHPKGMLFLSGFYEDDLPEINSKALDLGFKEENHLSKNKWIAAKFTR